MCRWRAGDMPASWGRRFPPAGWAGRHAAELRATFPDGVIGETLAEGRYDLILLCVRSADIEKALVPAAPLLAPDGAVVCLQNGLPEERVAKIVGPNRVLGAVIGWSASRGQGVTGGGEFVLGGTSPRRHAAAEILRKVAPVRETDNLAGAR